MGVVFVKMGDNIDISIARQYLDDIFKAYISLFFKKFILVIALLKPHSIIPHTKL